jgi:hypothetical protein
MIHREEKTGQTEVIESGQDTDAIGQEFKIGMSRGNPNLRGIMVSRESLNLRGTLAAGTLGAQKLSDLSEGDWSGDGDNGRGAKDLLVDAHEHEIDRQGDGI